MIQPSQKQDREPGSIAFRGFPLGENTSVPPLLLKPQEMESCIDFKLNPGGQLETREAVVKYSSAAVGTVHDVQTCVIGGTYRTLISAGTALAGYFIYYLNVKVPTVIGQVSGPAKITPYNNVALISDGSYLKYVDGVSAVKQAYDDGTDGAFYDNYIGAADGTTAVSAGGTGCVFTTPNWGSLTIPPTSVWVKCQEVVGTASLTAQIVQTTETAGTVDDTDVGTALTAATITFEHTVTGFLTGDKLNITLPASATSEAVPDSYEYTFTAAYVEATLLTALNDNANWTGTLSGAFTVVDSQLVFTYTATGIQADLADAAIGYTLVMATKAYTGTVPSASADYIQFIFVVAHELSPSTEYYCLIKGSNCNISHTTVASGGAMITSGSTPDTTKDPIMRVHPGLPPKASWAVVSGTRPFVYDPDFPGALYYGNMTQLDWSTANGGGYVTTVDASRTSFLIGAAQDLYGELFVYGTQNQPYLCKLTGATPENYSLPLLFQRIWSTQACVQNTGSDVWSASQDGVDALSGVQEYGDLRTYSASDPIKNRLANWTSSAFTGYNAKDGQLWFYMPGYSYVSVCHTKQPIRDQAGQVRYPWTRYELPFVPTCFSQTGLGFLIGSSDGFVYKLDSTEYKDLETTQIHPSFRTARIDMPSLQFHFTMTQFAGHSLGGSSFNFDVHVDGNASDSLHTWPFIFPMSDTLTVDDLIMDIDDMLSNVSPDQTPMFMHINFSAISVQFEVSSVHIAGYPVFFDGIFINYRTLER